MIKLTKTLRNNEIGIIIKDITLAGMCVIRKSDKFYVVDRSGNLIEFNKDVEIKILGELITEFGTSP